MDSCPVSMMTACPPPAPGLRRPPNYKRLEAEAFQRRCFQLAFGDDRDNDQLIQLWLGIFPVSWRQLKNPSPLARQLATALHITRRLWPQLVGPPARPGRSEAIVNYAKRISGDSSPAGGVGQ